MPFLQLSILKEAFGHVARDIISKELVEMVLKLLLSFAADPSVLKYDQVVVDGLSRLSEISRINRLNRIVLDELGVNAILLKRLPQVLSKTTGNAMLHAVVLDLLVQQAQFKMSRDDLQSFIDFFFTPDHTMCIVTIVKKH